MPLGSSFYFHRYKVRRSFYKKNLYKRALFFPLIFFLAFVALLYFFSGAAILPLPFAELQAFFFQGLKIDYLDFLKITLPGMGASGAGIKTGGDKGVLSPAERDVLGPADPRVFLHSELAGFKFSEATRTFLAGAADDAPSGEEKEALSFLLNRVEDRSAGIPLVLTEEKPRVLIYHTHASESFIPLSGQAFSDDPDLTVVSLGAYLAELLENKYGIMTLHYREFYDTPRHYAYERIRPSIARILQDNPRIQVVMDIHRDGVSRQVTTAQVKGMNTARILFVIGTNHGGWHSNLRLALFLQKEMEEKYPGLCRGLRNHTFVYNQDLHPRSLIVEIGGHENTKEELYLAAKYFAEALAAALP